MRNILRASMSLFLAFSATASDKNVGSAEVNLKKNSYVSVFGGPSKAGRVGESFSATNLSKTNAFGVALGKQFTDNIRLDFSLESRKNYKLNYTQIVSKYALNHEYNMKVNSLALMVNLYYDIVNYNKFTPYLVFGAGPTYNTVKTANISTIDEDEDVITNTLISNGYKTSFGYKLGLGTSYKMNESFSIGAQYQFVNLGGFRTGDIATTSTEYFSEPPMKGSIKARELLFNTTYKF